MISFNAARIVGAGGASSVGMSDSGTPKSLFFVEQSGTKSRPNYKKFNA